MATTAVGVDIGTRTVTVAEVASSRSGPRITNFGGIELSPGWVVDGEVHEPDAVANALRDLVAATKVRTRKVWLGVANSRVVVRQLDLPAMPLEDLRASIRYQVQEHIPIPVEHAELDVHVLAEEVTEDGERRQRVLIAAAHRDMVNRHVEAVQRAGLRAVGVDLNPFAMLRAIGNHSPYQQAGEVLVDVGGGVTDVVVQHGGTPLFVRILTSGGDEVTDAIAMELGIDHTEAERLKRTSDPTADGRLAALVARHVERLSEEIRSSIDYYLAQPGAAPLAGVALTGGGANLPGLSDQLAESLRLPVELGSVFDHWGAKVAAYDAPALRTVGPTLTTAVGLALAGRE
ncbi:type IV pilus assembly protein PilM [Egicoccus halophilus]|uniref:Cell division protein FtsA n=1 Tax=Egicoccus halophilus TaxID=1670830 RepID=A0A8J3EUK1_9ACTN|nr:type IV pilus assembly protein PilM [Egicoccus halophilus]GGI07361.1 cell division protein FtsA [Egicoccus halophilus]